MGKCNVRNHSSVSAEIRLQKTHEIFTWWKPFAKDTDLHQLRPGMGQGGGRAAESTSELLEDKLFFYHLYRTTFDLPAWIESSYQAYL